MALGMVGTLLYPYIIPMLLGRSFDLYTAQVGVDIFPQDTITDPIRIYRSYVTSDFRLIRNDSEARSFLGLTEGVSLRVKAGVLKIGASGDYLKDVQKRENYVEILVKSNYQTLTETLHGSKKPIDDWDMISPTYLGTHFVRSITYGGMLLASFRLYVQNSAEKTSLEEFLSSNFTLNEVKVTLERSESQFRFVREMNSFEEKLQKMMYDVKSKVGSDLSLRINYYSTVTAARVPRDLPTFLSVLQDFPFQAQKSNGGFGVPITAELIPLHELSARMMALKPSSNFDGLLSDLEEKYDDLLLTHKSLQSFANGEEDDDYQNKCKVRDLDMEVHDKLDVFQKVISNLNTASPDTVGLGEKAIQAYEQKPDSDSYFDRFKRLENSLKSPTMSGKHQSDSKHHTAGYTLYLAREDPTHSMKYPSDSIHQLGRTQAANKATSNGMVQRNGFSGVEILQQFGYLTELAMANGLCTSLNKVGGSFLTMRRNCSTLDAVPQTCSHVCRQLQTNHHSRGECVSVVAAQLHTPLTMGSSWGSTRAGEAIGAQTANLGRATCDRTTCFKEYCCCRLSRFSKTLL